MDNGKKLVSDNKNTKFIKIYEGKETVESRDLLRREGTQYIE